MSLRTASIALLLALSVTACQAPADPQVTPTDQVSVAASFYPLAFFAEQIGGSLVDVTQITPGGIEPHDFEPSPRDIAAIHDAKVFVMNGGVDAWGDKILPELSEEGVVTVRIEDSFAPAQPSDPHAWLDPVLAGGYVAHIREALIEADPAYAKTYNGNAEVLIADLTALDARFRSGLENCALREVIVSHDAFRYLALRYNFQTLAIAGLAPDEEPSAKRLAELSDLAEQKGIKHIFFEELVSPALAQTLASEVGATALVLNPLEGLTAEQIAAKENYVSIMNQNLANLRTAMRCS